MHEPSECLRHPGSRKPRQTRRARSLRTQSSQPIRNSMFDRHKSPMPRAALRSARRDAPTPTAFKTPKPRVSMHEPSECLRHPGSGKPRQTRRARSLPSQHPSPSRNPMFDRHKSSIPRTTLRSARRDAPTPTALNTIAQGKHARAERVSAPPWVTQAKTNATSEKSSIPTSVAESQPNV